jgi:pyridinium-3,5-bisthiocarboxylic acid mononucleotide nickel chelatase
MSTVLYFDCASGASGDMVLGALLDLGLPIEDLRHALAGLLPDGCRLDAARVQRSGISATHFQVIDEAAAHGHHHEHRGLSDIKRRIGHTDLPEAVKTRAQALFDRLGEVEADIHGIPVERVHFHEVGALDSIVDIVGAVWALHRLGAARIVSSPLNTGSGTVATSHGRLPVPAPATLRLLEGVPLYSSGIEMEMVTPTGALLITGHASSYGPLPALRVTKSGYGAGSRDIPGVPNVLRVVLGEESAAADAMPVMVIECNIDDMNPQFFGNLMDRLYAAGALDVCYAPVQMKKNRPGTMVTIVAPPPRRDALVDVLFRETTTIGVRYHEANRTCLARDWVSVSTPFGPVRVKVASRGGAVVNAAPEYDDCAARAAEHGVAVKDVHAAAAGAYWLDARKEPLA